MALFKRLKKDIGIEEETKKKTKKKEPASPKDKPVETKPDPEKKVPKKPVQKEEPLIKTPMSNKNNADWLKSKGQLAVDVYQTDTDFCIQAPIAGVNQENLDIAIENEMLVIKGEREEPDQEKERKYVCQECYWGPFSREVMLPEDLKTDKIKASLKKGILLVTIPKSKGVKKRVTIEVD